jgi:class 3 adenylate cyclase
LLNEEIQKKLAKRYGGEPLQKMVKEAFDKERIVKALKEPFELEAEAFSAITFMDIAGFSGKVAGMNAAETRAFLDGFYSAAIPKVYQYNGHIDRIIGDGILAVYSSHLSPELTSEKDAEIAAMNAAEKLIMELHGSDYACKVAMSVGKVLYCQTGLAEVYEDYTIIGEPLTAVYRIEEKVQVDQFAAPKSSLAGRRIIKQVEESDERSAKLRLLGGTPKPPDWIVTYPTVALRGIGDTELVVETFRSSK